MKDLQRTSVDKFLLENSVKLEDLRQEDVIPLESLCSNYKTINLDNRKLELFLNGVMLTFHEPDGTYRIYNSENFIGLGIVQNKLLKRDIIDN